MTPRFKLKMLSHEPQLSGNGLFTGARAMQPDVTLERKRGELAAVGAGTPGRRAEDMLSLQRPDLDWSSLAKGMGVAAQRVDDLQALGRALRALPAQRRCPAARPCAP